MKKIIILLTMLSFTINAQESDKLYPNVVPNFKESKNEEHIINSGGIDRVHNVSIPHYSFYKAKNSTSQAPCIILCPGGGYSILASSHEGTDVAEVLAENGVNVFLLYYRLPDPQKQKDPSIAPIQDAQMALRTVRMNADKWGIDKNKVGIMGFSAGGHLAASTSNLFKTDFLGLNDGANIRPDFSILIYPVITFRDFGHKGSKDKLLGEFQSEERIHLFSIEEQISKETPPAFLVHAADDGGVPVKNSLVYIQKMAELKNSVDGRIYAGGGHGFGMKNKTSSELWMDLLLKWMKDNHLK